MRRTLFDIVNGIYSGIPLCCIRFWIKECRVGGEIGLRVDARRGNPHVLAGYVQCDKCYHKGKVVKIRHNGSIVHWL